MRHLESRARGSGTKRRYKPGTRAGGGQCVLSWRLRPLGVRVLSYDLSNSFFSMKARGMEAMLDLVVFEFLYCADVFVFVFG